MRNQGDIIVIIVYSFCIELIAMARYIHEAIGLPFLTPGQTALFSVSWPYLALNP